MRRIAALLCFLMAGVNALAQTPNGGTLRVTVVDLEQRRHTPAPTVTVAGAEDAAIKGVGGCSGARPPRPALPSCRTCGPAATPSRRRSRASIHGRSPTSGSATATTSRWRSSRSRGSKRPLTVGQDKQEAAADRQGPSFGTALTRDQIEALSDDPADAAAAAAGHGRPGRRHPHRRLRGQRACRPRRRFDRFASPAISLRSSITTPAARRSRSSPSPGIGPVRYFTNFAHARTAR